MIRLIHYSKCFTYLTKTCANTTTYSRKPGNFNGTISFEIDIMKNSSPINSNLGQNWLFHICFDLLWSWAESAVSPAEKKCYFGFDMAKIVNFKLSGDEFFMMSTSKIMVPLQSPGFLLYVVEFAIILATYVKHLLLQVFQPIIAQLGNVMGCIMIGQKASRRTKYSRAPDVNKIKIAVLHLDLKKICICFNFRKK